MTNAALVYSDDILNYDFGPQHPLRPVRYKLTRDLMDAYGLFDGQVHLVEPPAASDAEIELVHDPGYVRLVRALGDAGRGTERQAGLGAGDNPVFPRMHEVTAVVAGGSIAAAGLVMEGTLDYAFNISGGLHHALPGRAAGFCVYNDPAIAIAWLLRHGAERVAYIDTDAHHGDGVQWIFYDDPRVLTVSIHESGRYLFPGTGHVEEIGKDRGRGTSINIPLEPGASDADMLLAFDEAAVPLVSEFRPEFLVLQHGCDSHHLDPLTHLDCTMAVFGEIGKRERALAENVSEGRAISGGGGGYAYREVVPRAWLSTFAGYAGIALPETLPETWRHAAGVSASELTADRPAPDKPLASTTETIARLHAELGRFQG